MQALEAIKYVISPSAPLSVAFTDASTGTIASWIWDFGDGDSSTAQHPSHTYTTPGTYTVSLTVTGPGGSADTQTKIDYITAAWTDYRVRLTMRSDDDDARGVMFRYQDNDNYYRFSWDSQRTYRRLVKREDGVFTLLAEDAVPYVVGQTYQVEIIAQGPQLEVWIDGVQIFAVTDTSFASGTIALYAWADEGSTYDDIVVEELATGTVLLADDFNDGEFTGWTIMDEGTQYGPSVWSATTGALVQSSNINTTIDDADITRPGTYALYTAGGD